MTRDDVLSERQKFEATLVKKAWEDAAFRARLIADPKGVLQEELRALGSDETLAGDLTIKLVTETPNEMTIVLPVDPTVLEPDLLDEVAGGSKCTKTCTKTSCFRIGCEKTVTCSDHDPQPCAKDISVPIGGTPIGGI